MGAQFLPFFFQPSSTLAFPSQGFGRRFRCLRINYFNLALTLIVARTHPVTTHLPLRPTFKEQSSPQTVSFLINFSFFLIALGNFSAPTRWYIAHPCVCLHTFFEWLIHSCQLVSYLVKSLHANCCHCSKNYVCLVFFFSFCCFKTVWRKAKMSWSDECFCKVQLWSLTNWLHVN